MSDSFFSSFFSDKNAIPFDRTLNRKRFKIQITDISFGKEQSKTACIEVHAEDIKEALQSASAFVPDGAIPVPGLDNESSSTENRFAVILRTAEDGHSSMTLATAAVNAGAEIINIVPANIPFHWTIFIKIDTIKLSVGELDKRIRHAINTI